jgi:signal transduction histidine kinase
MMLAQSRQAAMGEMISMIAHQWRQPLTVISMDANNMLVDLELGNFDKESVRESSNSILHQSQYLSKTINDFRDFFRPNQEKEKFVLKSVIEDTYEIIDHSFKNNEISLTVHDDIEITLLAHKRELVQVFINLLNNAKDAAIEHVKVDRKIEIYINKDGENIIIKICDNGGGIDIDIQEKIFEPYFSTKTEKNGTGLGLYMSKTIIEKHFSGQIRIDNHENGVCATVLIPQKQV